MRASITSPTRMHCKQFEWLLLGFLFFLLLLRCHSVALISFLLPVLITSFAINAIEYAINRLFFRRDAYAVSRLFEGQFYVVEWRKIMLKMVYVWIGIENVGIQSSEIYWWKFRRTHNPIYLLCHRNDSCMLQTTHPNEMQHSHDTNGEMQNKKHKTKSNEKKRFCQIRAHNGRTKICWRIPLLLLWCSAGCVVFLWTNSN